MAIDRRRSVAALVGYAGYVLYPRFDLPAVRGAGLLVLAGGAIALGAAPLFAQVTFTSLAGRVLRIVVGSLLLLLGFLQVRGISPGSGAVYELARPMVEAQARLRQERPTLAFGLFGFSYILAGLAGHALATGGRSAAFVVTALTMVFLVFALALLVGAAQQRVVEALKAGTQQVKRWGGVVVMAVGAWLIILAIWADFFARVFPV